MAYASVASLMRTMGSVLTLESPMGYLVGDHREEFVAFHEKVSFLQVLLKNFEKNNNSGKMTDMEAQIKELATVVEHKIQLKLTQIHFLKNDEMQKETIRESLFDSLKHVAEELDNVQKESPKFQDKGKHAPKESLVQDSSSGMHAPSMVGRDDQRKRILVELTRYGGSSGELKVIPIVGMGGIGKTTLAREVYNDAFVQSHFDVRAWATISQQHNVQEILLSLLCSTKGDKFYMDDESVLADMLQKSLKGKRYLIVLDDMWKSEAWDDLRLCFPSENNGSRILLTTRNTEVACSAGTENLSMQMGLMDLDESWNLFESITRADEALPSEFETIGKQIVDQCHGLPLTIVVVAGLLKSKRTIEYWENVAKDVKSIINDPDKQCLDVLGLSYNHLTSDLKACLLYFGIFPEDCVISAKRLARLWMAEGFLKLENDLEGEANKCLQELVDRCLVLVIERSRDETKIRSCKVHDLIYELCLRELTQSQDIFSMNDILPKVMLGAEAQSSNHVPPERYCLARALLTPGYHHLIRGETNDDDYNLLNRTHFIFCQRSSTLNLFGGCILQSELLHFKLLRILDLNDIIFRVFPREILHLIWLRYLSGYFVVPPEISNLCNLQTLITQRRNYPKFPQQIWELMKLRHLETRAMDLPNPPRLDEERYIVLSNLHTLSGMSPTCCTKEVISGIRNVKKLGLRGNKEEYRCAQESRLFDNLFNLHQLETLSFVLDVWHGLGNNSLLIIPSAKAFPSTLKKLKLIKTYLRWEDLNIIGELCNLEVLKLMYHACYGEEWHPIEGGFAQLKTLQIVWNKLKHWKATNDNFPILERLMIKSCNLEEIPIEFAEINSLKLIKLEYCSTKLEASAARIQQEQEDLGNTPVDVCLADLNIIGELRNLEVLKLKQDACCGEEWHPIEGGFAQLKALQIVQNHLKYWKATNDNFPVLEHLMIGCCYDLEEIPIEFAEINPVKIIKLEYCMPKLVDSAARIQQEQEDL